MKKILLAAVVFANVAILSAQQELLLINENGTGLREGKISVIDSDNDGKHNVIFAGRADKNTKDRVYIFKVQGDDTFTPVDNTIPIPGGQWISTTWEDINGDGRIDLFTSGIKGEGGGNYVTLLTNNGDGTYTDNWELDLPQNAPGSAAADFDNDGIIDFLIYGFKTDGTLTFRNEDNSVDESINVLPQGVTLFGDANVTLLDINNDGYIDFYLCGYVHDADAKRRYSGLFINNGNRTFTETSVLPSGKASNQATTLFADINGDGIMEMIFYGHEGSGSMYVYQYIDGEFVESMPIEGIYQTKTVVNSGVLADINNDGYYDLIANVYNGINNNPRERLFFFIGDEFGLFELNEELSSQVMGGSNGSVAVLDSNNDGILDFAVMGYNFNQNNNDAFCAIYKNTTYTATNAAPSAPSNLENSVDGNNVVLSWGEATDDKTPTQSLTYNIYLRNKTTGRYYRHPKANLSTGKRMVLEHGNTFLAKQISFNNLPDGDYEWTVQAIDAAYAGGAFAEMKNFTIGKGMSINTQESEAVKVTVDVQNKNIKIVTADAISEVCIYNMEGELLKSTSNNVISDFGYTSGVYIIKVRTLKDIITKKIVF